MNSQSYASSLLRLEGTSYHFAFSPFSSGAAKTHKPLPLRRRVCHCAFGGTDEKNLLFLSSFFKEGSADRLAPPLLYPRTHTHTHTHTHTLSLSHTLGLETTHFTQRLGRGITKRRVSRASDTLSVTSLLTRPGAHAAFMVQNVFSGLPVMAQQNRIRLGTMTWQVRSLASTAG